jgi:hypothetical protein
VDLGVRRSEEHEHHNKSFQRDRQTTYRDIGKYTSGEGGVKVKQGSPNGISCACKNPLVL